MLTVKNLRRRLTYSNIVASLALFIALGGVSYAAMQLPKGSVGTKQLKPQAVSTAKIKDGAITANKIQDGAVGGAKVDASSLGQVPSAANASRSREAEMAERAALAGSALEAHDALRLGGAPAAGYGTVLMSHTKIPATNGNAEWWIPVSGVGEPGLTRDSVEMMMPRTGKTIASKLAVFAREGPSGEDNAWVEAQLYSEGRPAGQPLQVRGSYPNAWYRTEKCEVGDGAMLAIRITERANGEEIPALGIQTALFLHPAVVPAE